MAGVGIDVGSLALVVTQDGAFTSGRRVGLPTISIMLPRSRRDPRSVEANRVADRVRGLLRARDEVGACREALLAYGAEVYGFLLGVLDDPATAGALYADVQKRVATEVGGFVQRCSLRTWLYLLARRELRERRLQGRDETPSRSLPASGERRRTQPDPISDLRVSLTQEERELLILRVDRDFTWCDVALTELGERTVDRYQIAQVTRSVRERVEAIVERLRQAAANDINVPPERHQ
jgi:DNA-directed RNA polymerase specialized sigma24 family protein